MAVLRGTTISEYRRSASSTPSRELMGEKRTIVTATLVSVGVVAAGAQLAVTVLLLLLHGLVRHWNTFVGSDTVVEHTHNNMTHYNVTHTHEVLNELTYLSDAFRTYPAFSAVWVVSLYPTVVIISCVLKVVWHSMGRSSNKTQRAVSKGGILDEDNLLVAWEFFTNMSLLMIVFFNNGEETSGWHVTGVIVFLLLFALGHVLVIRMDWKYTKRPYIKAVDKCFFLISFVAVIVFTVAWSQMTPTSDDHGHLHVPIIFTWKSRINNSASVIGEWVLLFCVLYFNLMLCVRTIRLSLWAHDKASTAASQSATLVEF
jgi:hypothetical protein